MRVRGYAVRPRPLALPPLNQRPELTARPADTVLTRMYNQNTVKDPITGRVKGALYTNPIDCLWKTFKAEGIAGWYKGEPSLLPRAHTAHFFLSDVTVSGSVALTYRYHGAPAQNMAAHRHHPRRQRAHHDAISIRQGQVVARMHSLFNMAESYIHSYISWASIFDHPSPSPQATCRGPEGPSISD